MQTRFPDSKLSFCYKKNKKISHEIDLQTRYKQNSGDPKVDMPATSSKQHDKKCFDMITKLFTRNQTACQALASYKLRRAFLVKIRHRGDQSLH